MDALSTTDSYLTFIQALTHLDFMSILSAFFLTMGRILPIMALAPFLGAKNVPNAIKVMFGISICAIIFPHVLLSLKEPLSLNLLFTGLFLKELSIGLILGFLITVPFYIAQSSGSLIDHIRGSSSLQVTDPTTKTQASSIGIFYNYTLIVVFFLLGGPFLFIDGLATSFQLLPIDHFLNPGFFNSKMPFWQLIISLLNRIVTMAIQLGAPSLIGILMAEMFLGIANRLSPKVQIVFLGISLKSWVGLALLTAAWVFIIKQLGVESINWLKVMEKTIRQISV
jgi:type III secretion protein T